MDQSTELPLVATEGIPDAARRYREQVLRVYNSLSLTGLPERDPRLNQLPLDEIFVPLSIDVNIPPATPDIRDQEQRLKVLETFAHMYQPIEGSGVMEYLGTTGLDALKGEAAMRGSQRRAGAPAAIGRRRSGPLSTSGNRRRPRQRQDHAVAMARRYLSGRESGRAR